MLTHKQLRAKALRREEVRAPNSTSSAMSTRFWMNSLKLARNKG